MYEPEPVSSNYVFAKYLSWQADTIARQKILRVAEHLRDAGIPQQLQDRVQRHLRTVLIFKRIAINTDELLRELSGPLRAAVALHRCQSLLMSPKFVSLLVGDGTELDRSFIKNLVTRLQLCVFSPDDYVTEEGDSANQVYFLASGRLEVRVHGRRSVAQLAPGACFGEIAVLIPNTRRTATIVALTFSEAHELTRQDFMSCLDDFPVLKNQITTLAEQRLRQLQGMESDSLDARLRRFKVVDPESDETDAEAAEDQSESSDQLSDDDKTKAERTGVSWGAEALQRQPLNPPDLVEEERADKVSIALGGRDLNEQSGGNSPNVLSSAQDWNMESQNVPSSAEDNEVLSCNNEMLSRDKPGIFDESSICDTTVSKQKDSSSCTTAAGECSLVVEQLANTMVAAKLAHKWTVAQLQEQSQTTADELATLRGQLRDLTDAQNSLAAQFRQAVDEERHTMADELAEIRRQLQELADARGCEAVQLSVAADSERNKMAYELASLRSQLQELTDVRTWVGAKLDEAAEQGLPSGLLEAAASSDELKKLLIGFIHFSHPIIVQSMNHSTRLRMVERVLKAPIIGVSEV